MKRKSTIIVTEQQLKDLVLKNLADNPEKFLKSFFKDLFKSPQNDDKDDDKRVWKTFSGGSRKQKKKVKLSRKNKLVKNRVTKKRRKQKYRK